MLAGWRHLPPPPPLLIRAFECKDMLEFLCETKCPFVTICNSAVAAVRLIRIVREGKHDADIYSSEKDKSS